MSSTVKSTGFFIHLEKTIPEDLVEDIYEKLWENEANRLHISCEHDLVYIDNCNRDYDAIYGFSRIPDSTKERIEFFKLVSEYFGDYKPIASTIKPYACIWYNGSDSPMYYMTKEKYKEI